MIYKHIVVLKSQMLHAKFHGFIEIGPPAPEKKIFEASGICHIWEWWPSWSYDLGYLLFIKGSL